MEIGLRFWVNEIILRVNGNQYLGWKSVNIQKSMTNIAGSFSLSAANQFPGELKKWKIIPGDTCSVEIDNQVIITGYIDDLTVQYNQENHLIQVVGRDKTSDLIDCSYDLKNRQWNGQKISAIIKSLCTPFGIDVVVDKSVSENASFIFQRNVQDVGNSVFDAIITLCRIKDLFPITYGDGKLTLTRVSTEYSTDILETGVNIKSCRSESSDKDRFQTYTVKGNDEKEDIPEIPILTQPSESTTDSDIKRYRPLIILAEKKLNAYDCKNRARWEKNTRAGRSRKIIYTVPGWIQSDGTVWQLNKLVRVKDSLLGVQTNGKIKYVISDLTFNLDDSGTTTEITLMPPDTFSILEAITANTVWSYNYGDYIK